MKIKIYGSCGSIPFFNRKNVKHRINTSCVRIDTGGHTIILDCGSGLIQFAADMKTMEGASGAARPAIDILISHLHIDHIIGLSAFSPIWRKDNNIRIFTKSRDERPLSEQIFGIFKPPYWPVDLETLNHAQIIGINNEDSFMLNKDIKITPLPACHPDDTTVFRIDAEGKSVVYLLDYEVGEDLTAENRLTEFCRDAHTVIFDSTYLHEDYHDKRGWGHSHCKAGIKLAELSGCRCMIFSHFSVDYTDETLEHIACGDELRYCAETTKYYFAYDGMEVNL